MQPRCALLWLRRKVREEHGVLWETVGGMSGLMSEQVPDENGRFGPYGGRYVPETLMHPLMELEEE